MATSANRKTVKVFVNAGEKAISFSRTDGKGWDFPLFVTAPNGVREHLITEVLRKGADGKATNTVTFLVAEQDVEQVFAQTGPNAGKPYFRFTISEDNLADWLDSLDVRARGTASSSVLSILAKDAEKRGTTPTADDGEEPF
jgi:hypothetical protein